MERFELAKFKNPPKAYTPVYAWVWNGPVSRETTDAQLEELKRLGIRACYIIPEPKTFRPARIPTQMEPDYLTKPYFEEYRYAMEKARDMGLTCWFYDEGGWPSGGACGKVLTEHPEVARRTLTASQTELPANTLYRKPEEVLATFRNGMTLVEDGALFAEAVTLTEYRNPPKLFQTPGIPDFPDLTLPESTQYFLEMTHEQYKPYLQSLFGDSMTAVFTDEPTAPRPIPFNDYLCRRYEETYGESILPYLPILTGDVTPDSETDRSLHRWFDLCSRAFCENFLLSCKKWANENNMVFTGHMDRDHVPFGCMQGGNFHLLRALRCMDIPGIDVIWGQIFPGKPFALSNGDTVALNGFFPRFASSAAAQNGRKLAMTESFGVYGNGLTFDLMRFCYGFQAIRGVTVFNPLLISYARKGYQLTGELPTFDEKTIYHADLPVINAYAERLSYVLSCGDRLCDTALYDPICDLWCRKQELADEFDRLGRQLEDCGIDFDIIDDDILADCTTENGMLRFGRQTYRQIVIPEQAYLPQRTKEVLNSFVQNGGRILHCAEHATSQFGKAERSPLIRMQVRKTENGILYCLFNENDKAETCRITVQGDHGYLIDITNGKLHAIRPENSAVEIHLESGETCAVLITEDTLASETVPNTTKEQPLCNWTFRPTEQFILGEMEAERKPVDSQSKAVALGDWSSLLGRSFSGSGIYETNFTVSEEDCGKCGILDMGDVRYTCACMLNGQDLGIKVMPPYRFEIPEGLLQAQNTLTVRVTNTPANEYAHTKTFDKWPAWMLTPYHEIEKSFYEKVLYGGLYGPVAIQY